MTAFRRATAMALPLASMAALGLADDGKVMIELNKLSPGDGGCQAFIVVENGTTTAFDSLSLDLVMFDVDGIIARRLAVDLAPLRAGKTSVKVFPVEGLACDAVGRILVNDVLSCTGAGVAANGCLERIETRSRAPIELVN